MKNRKQPKKSVVNRFRLIVIPIFITIIFFILISSIHYFLSKNILLRQMEESGKYLTDQTMRQIVGKTISLKIVNEMLDEKIRVSGRVVIENREDLSNEYLTKLLETLQVDELHWMDENGKILYSTVPGYIDWEPYLSHPLYEFVREQEKELIEEIRPDAKYGKDMKYGSIKDMDGSFVQIGLSAEHVMSLTDRLSYQALVDGLITEKNIAYVKFLNEDLRVISDSDQSSIGEVYKEKEKLKQVLEGETLISTISGAEKNENILEFSVPIKTEGKIKGIFIIGLSMEDVLSSINRIVYIEGIISIFLILLLILFYNRNLIRPVKRLDGFIDNVDVENDLYFRLPIKENDIFYGLIDSFNKNLDRTQSYFEQLKEKELKLSATNKEISEAYEQLSMSEEELRMGFEEIQTYTEKIEDIKQKYEIAIKGTKSVVWEYNLSDHKVYLSYEANALLGISDTERMDVSLLLDSYLPQEDIEAIKKEYRQYIAGEKEFLYIHIRIVDEAGNKRWYLLHGKGVFSLEGDLILINGILQDINHLKEQEAYIEYMAYHDALTKLPNRRMFIQKLEEELEKNHFGAVMLLDLDNFKDINDMLGHSYGDEVLKKVGNILIGLKEDNQNIFVSRFGGDEFLILMTEEESVELIEGVAQTITNIFKHKIVIENDEIFLSCSIGVTRYPSDSKDVNQLIMNADMSMYMVKNLGKNNYMFFDPSMMENMKEQIETEKVLRDALEKDQFKILYQPIIHTQSGEVMGFEALLRLKDSTILPSEFIPVAEKSGLIIDIGRWVSKTVIGQLASWRKKGFEMKPIAINFSAKQLYDETYIDFLEETFKVYDIEPRFIEVEITESILLNETDEIIKFLNKLKGLGIQIALDDFGTGYSSLSYLTFIPVDKIKLDKSLNDKFLEIENIKVMDSIISLAHSLNLSVIAEGIEFLDQYKRLKIGSCDYIQGFLFSKPLEMDEAEEIYNSNFLTKLKK